MSEAKKDTIYIDVDDEITSIIDKVRGSEHKVVALVLPKRASVLQSIVNMKLLKRTAENEKKNLVLITSESGLLPLAGAVGIHVAKTLQSKPEIPLAPEMSDGTDAIDEPVDVESEPDDFDPKKVGKTAIGDLAGTPEPSTKASALDADDSIDLNEDELAATSTIAESRADAKKRKKDKKDKKLKVPNFLKFRRLLLLGGVLLIGLIVLLIVLIKVLPKATVTIQTNSSNVPASLSLNLSTAATLLDPSTLTLPTTLQQTTKTNTQQVPTTGKQNNGVSATGSITMTDCVSGFSFPSSVPAGTGVTSSGLTFITQNTTNFSHSGTPEPQSSCEAYQATGPTNITAQSGGSSYNVSNATFGVAGRSDVSATGSTSGGTDNIIQIVAQADVDSATQKLTAQDTSAVKQTLENTLTGDGLYPIPATFVAGTPNNSVSPSVGTQADNVTVTQSVVYSMMGVKQSDLQTLLDNSIKQQINTSQQTILDDGLNNANYNVVNISSSQAQVTMTTTGVVGSQLNVATIKKQIVGKKSGDVQGIIKGYPGVVNVNVHFSPFWVSSIPSNTSKTTIKIQKPGS